MELKVIRDGLAHLTLKGCLNYDVRLAVPGFIHVETHALIFQCQIKIPTFRCVLESKED